MIIATKCENHIDKIITRVWHGTTDKVLVALGPGWYILTGTTSRKQKCQSCRGLYADLRESHSEADFFSICQYDITLNLCYQWDFPLAVMFYMSIYGGWVECTLAVARHMWFASQLHSKCKFSVNVTSKY